jgi:hypothetical protein
VKRRRLNRIERVIDGLNVCLRRLTRLRDAQIEKADPLRRELNDF